MFAQIFVLTFVAATVVLFGTALLLAAVFTVEQGTAVVVQRLGRFLRVAGPGLRWRVPLLDRLAGRVSLRLKQLEVAVETKTEDDVFVHVALSVQYFVLPEKVSEAFYLLEEASRPITAYVLDVVASQVPRLKLAHLFTGKAVLADLVKGQLAQVMQGYGYGILNVLVIEVEPDARGKAVVGALYASRLAGARLSALAEKARAPQLEITLPPIVEPESGNGSATGSVWSEP